MNLPTGFGKSLVFELTPLCFDLKATQPLWSLRVIIISPLISLMESQVENMLHRGLKAARLSSINPESARVIKELNYVFLSPEALQESKWVSLLREPTFRESVCAVFIDEAHCIVQWGLGSAPFRASYAVLGDIRSFTKAGTPMIAMTATATKSAMSQITKVCGMKQVAYVVESQNRPNIRYAVKRITKEDVNVFSWLIVDLKEKGCNCDKVLIFCQKIDDCVKLYQFFATALVDCAFIPPGECILQNALFGMFHAKITNKDKDILLRSYSDPDGKCRVMFATIAFGMGMNIPNIHTVVHYGPSSTIDNYVQESGRAGRDGKRSDAVILVYPGALRGNISKPMKSYCKDEWSTCRRNRLMQEYLGQYGAPIELHTCCDICAAMCKCGTCHLAIPKCISSIPSGTELASNDREEPPKWEDEKSESLRHELQELFLKQPEQCDAECKMYVQDELLTGRSDHLVEQIVANAPCIDTLEDLKTLCHVWGDEEQILMAIEKVKDIQ